VTGGIELRSEGELREKPRHDDHYDERQTSDEESEFALPERDRDPQHTQSDERTADLRSL
jgi:hypothetical protein